MRTYIEREFNCTVIRWAEWDGEVEEFAVIFGGEYIVAESLGLLMSELQSRTHQPLVLRRAA